MKNNITKLHDRELKQSEVETKPLDPKISEIRKNIPLLSKILLLHWWKSDLHFNSNTAEWIHLLLVGKFLVAEEPKSGSLQKWFFSSLPTNQSVLFRIAYTEPGIKENHCFSLTPFCHYKALHSVTFCKWFLLESSKILHTTPSASTIRVQYT